MIRDFHLLGTTATESLDPASYPIVSIDIRLVYGGNRGLLTEGEEQLRNKIHEFIQQTIESNGAPLGEYHIALEDQLHKKIKELEDERFKLYDQLTQKNNEISEILLANELRGLFRSRKIKQIHETYQLKKRGILRHGEESGGAS